MDEKQKDRKHFLTVFMIAFLVYANSLGNGFVTDDSAVILNNPVLQGSPLALFSAIDSIGESQILPFYRPLTYLTFAVERWLHGFNPFWMHLVNVLLHATNASLVFLFARELFNDYRPALIVGLLFAVHPVNSESVNFLSGGRNTMLASSFVLMACLAHRRSIARRSLSVAIVGAVFFFAGLLSKEFAVMVLPFIIAEELTSLQGKEAGARSASLMRLAPYALAMTGYLILRWLALSRLGLQSGLAPGFGAQKLQELYSIPDFSERMMNNMYIIPKYLLTIVWPTSLSPRYAVPGDLHAIAPQLIAGWACILAGIGWLLIWGRRKATLFGLSWIFAYWMPVSGIVYFSLIEMADRYLYIPAIGLWIIIADQSFRRIPQKESAFKYMAIAAAMVVLALSALTVTRNLDWKSDLTLFSRMVDQHPENPHGYYHLGRAYLNGQGQYDLQHAEKNFEQTLVLDPSTPSVHTLLGYIRLQRRDLEGAIYYLSEALRRDPLDREARMNRGIAYEEMGRYKDALSDYKLYLTIPGHNDLPGSQEYAQEKVIELGR